MELKFSLIVGTKNRQHELAQLLDSLMHQSYQNFEVIIIDQNSKEFLDEILQPFKKSLKIKHLYSDIGLSKARNIGIKAAQGDIVAFPDDDCEYPASLLLTISEIFQKHSDIQGFSGTTIDKETKTESVGRFNKTSAIINQKNFWNTHNSGSLFFKKELVSKVGLFDEDLGVGTEYGSSEETDYLIRALKLQFRILYDPEIYIYHPDKDTTQLDILKKRGRSYGKGLGKLVVKHWNFLSAKDIVKIIIGPLLVVLFKFPNKSARVFYWEIFKGRILGIYKNLP